VTDSKQAAVSAAITVIIKESIRLIMRSTLTSASLFKTMTMNILILIRRDQSGTHQELNLLISLRDRSDSRKKKIEGDSSMKKNNTTGSKRSHSSVIQSIQVSNTTNTTITTIIRTQVLHRRRLLEQLLKHTPSSIKLQCCQ